MIDSTDAAHDVAMAQAVVAAWSAEVLLPAEPVFRECDARTLAMQVGPRTILAISGGRITVRETGITLPVSNGYSVTIDLAGNDTYTVRRLFKRAGRVWVKGEVAGVYCDQVGEVAYMASCFRSDPFGDAA